MAPSAFFVTGKWIYSSPKLEQYNGISTVEILEEPVPGYSSGDATKTTENIAAKLPEGFHIPWTGLFFEERLSSSQAPALYAPLLLIVFLCLAASYESWNILFSVVLAVPLGVLGVVYATLLRGLDNDVFFQAGLLTTIGLSVKDAILITEFVRELYEKEGLSIKETVVEAMRVRLKPVIMTSLAFVVGVIPLVAPTEASSGSEYAIGTGVAGGMITTTILAIFYIPLFYMSAAGFFSRRSKKSSGKIKAEQSQARINIQVQ